MKVCVKVCACVLMNVHGVAPAMKKNLTLVVISVGVCHY